MSDIEGYCRTHQLLLPDLLDDSVTEENPVRFLDAYVERLDLECLGFARAHAALTGRPGDDPRDVLKPSIDGDLNRIRSSRRPGREAPRHVELIWLVRKLQPDFKTIADVRQHHTQALPALFRAFVLLCTRLDLFGAELLAIDGRTFKAVNSPQQICTTATLEKALKALDEKVEPYLRDLAASDREESSVPQPPRAELQEKIERLKARQQRYHGFVQEITASGETQRSRTDPDRRSMPTSPKVDVGDNVQIAVESKPTRMVRSVRESCPRIWTV